MSTLQYVSDSLTWATFFFVLGYLTAYCNGAHLNHSEEWE